MRMIFGVLGLLVVVAVVGVLARKQLGSATAPGRAAPEAQAVPGLPATAAGATPATPQQQVQQFKGAVEGAMQAPRPTADER